MNAVIVDENENPVDIEQLFADLEVAVESIDGGGGGGSGDVTGPASSVDNEIAGFDGTTGKTLKGLGYTITTLIALFLSTARTWISGANATTISATGIAASDATDGASLNSIGVTVTNGTAQATLSKTALQIGDGSGSSAEFSATSASISGSLGGISLSENTIAKAQAGVGVVWVENNCVVTIDAEALLTGNSVPIEIVLPLSEDANKVLVPTKIIARNRYESDAYSSDSLAVLNQGSAFARHLFITSTDFMKASVDLIELMKPNVNLANGGVLTPGAKLVVMTDADSATGDGSVELYITCELITLKT